MTRGERLKILLDVQSRYELPIIKLVIGRRKRSSRASYRPDSKQYMVSMSLSWEHYGTLACTADLLHELCHIICYVRKNYDEHHGPKFRELERQLLSDYGLVAKYYGRAYYDRLETAEGEMIYHFNKK